MRKPLVDIGASARARLLAIAKERRLAFEVVLTRYTLERLLDRLSRSAHSEKFVLKGAMLVTTWLTDVQRATRDLDLLGFGDPDMDVLRATIAEIMAIEADDGLVFDTTALQVRPIREADAYGGIRLRTTATLAAAKIPVTIDVAFGDAVEPGIGILEYPVLLDHARPRLRAYAPETVVAEKVQAMVALGLANTRMKDFYDVWQLTHAFDLDEEGLERAIAATFARRDTAIPKTLPEALSSAFADDPAKQRQWAAFVEELAMKGTPLPKVVTDLAAYLMPLFAKCPTEKRGLNN